MKNNQLSDDVGQVDGNRMWTNMAFDYSHQESLNENPNRLLSFEAEMNDQSLLMYSVKEAYARIGHDGADTYIGRKILPWSTVDANWGFGKLNNRVNFNGFTPGQEGLTGVNHVRRWGGTKLSLFGSLLYIPEMNPSLDINEAEGTLSSRSPWVKAPNSTVDIGGKSVPVFYDVEYPEIDQVVFRYSVGLNLEQALTEDTRISGFYMKKPENTISISADASLITGANQRINAEVDPEVYYHDVAGVSLEGDLSDYLSLYAGLIGIYPEVYPDSNQQEFEYTGIKEEKIKEEYFGSGVVYKDYKTSVSLHYVLRLSDYTLGESLLSQAPRWNEAFNFNFSFTPLDRWQALVDLKYDILSRDRLGMVAANYQWNKNLVVGGGVQMVGAPRNEGTYWGQFRNNDSVYTHLMYAF